ncbi:MAG TPA: chemotaxis protein CheW [Gemmatimonadales bacterium]|jgi:purine-binding chemotaxis protein CheW|nr:chemotaxis protein CheW [Gemmatimonadales bacterium]
MVKFNWQEVHARLDRTRRMLEAGQVPSPEVRARVLRTRAATLARRLPQTEVHADTLELLTFMLGGGRYGVAATRVSAVMPLRDLTPVPCTPAFILGVVNHRGRILPVLDLRKLLELPSGKLPDGCLFACLEQAGMTFGLLIETVMGTLRVAMSDLRAPAGLPDARQALLLGVTPDMTAVLDLDALARDPRIVVNEAV